MNATSKIAAVSLERVSRLYGNFAALRDISLTLPAGSSVMLLGENGAGKSTLLRVIAGLASPTYGTVRVFHEPPLAIRERIAYLSHAAMLYDELTARENLEYFASLHDGQTPLRPVAEALASVHLDPANSRRVGDYSQGMRQRTALARVLLTQPDLLLLDEPFSNLDIASVASITARLKAFTATPNASGLLPTLLFTTHQPDLARDLTTQVLTLREGRLA